MSYMKLLMLICCTKFKFCV